MKHTPGPWMVLEVMGHKFVAAKPTPDHPYFGKTRHIDIAGAEEYPRRNADLALKAAAPELLEALEGLRKHYDSFYGPLWDKAEEAIRKARTETV